MRKIIFTPEALDDLRAAKDWYERQQTGLAAQLEEAVHTVLMRVQHMPESAPEAVPPFRRVPIRRFRYSLYYRVVPTAVVVVLLHHTSRDPATILRRLGPH
jgi:toxin ParE1/3/4